MGLDSIHWLIGLDGGRSESLQLIVRKGRGLNGINDWRSPKYISREKSDVSLEEQVMTLFDNIAGVDR